MTLGQLLAAYSARQRAEWDHTCTLISCWTGKPCRNPYRRPERRKYMHPSELHALAKAIEERNKNA